MGKAVWQGKKGNGRGEVGEAGTTREIWKDLRGQAVFKMIR